MSRWITFYNDLINGISDFRLHWNKEIATEYFKNHYQNYFQLSTKIEIKLPMTYGYPHRSYVGMSFTEFKKIYGYSEEELREIGVIE